MLSATDSFEAVWPALAGELELDLARAGTAAELGGESGTIALIAAAGDEALLEPLLRECAGGDLVVAAVGALPDHRLAGAVLRAGAAAYFALPGDLELLRSWLGDRADRARLATAGRRFSADEAAAYRFDGILGSSEALRAALDRAARVIPHGGVTVLLTGETGTGKELLARAIHYNGPRAAAPFVDINCAAIPDNLLESELFGHERGAFTGADAAKPGLLELANGGTVFLDEVAHLPLPLQGKLLRALQERAIRRVGGTRTIAFDVRVVAATHVRLADAVRRGEFREDLYYRLNVVPIELPPLRGRPGDLLPLARHFLASFAAEYALPAPRLTRGAEHALTQRAWPGNVRELRNAVERALLLASGDALDAQDFALDGDAAGSAVAGGPGGSAIPFPAAMDEIERGAAHAMLALCAGNKSDAARRLDVSRARLQRLLDDAAVPLPDAANDRPDETPPRTHSDA